MRKAGMAAHLLFIPQQQWPQLVQLVQFHNSWYSWYSWTQCLANAEHSGKIARRVKQKMYLVEKQLLTLARPQKLGSRTHLKIHTFSTLPHQSCHVLYLYVCLCVGLQLHMHLCTYVLAARKEFMRTCAQSISRREWGTVPQFHSPPTVPPKPHNTQLSHFYVEGIF